MNQIAQRLIDAYYDGELQPQGCCLYEDPTSGKPCAVGFLLTQEQRDKIKWAGENEMCGINSVESLTTEEIEATTGLTRSQLNNIQVAFDNDGSAFPRTVRRIIGDYVEVDAFDNEEASDA
jgi:hypothetical protein